MMEIYTTDITVMNKLDKIYESKKITKDNEGNTVSKIYCVGKKLLTFRSKRKS